MPLPAPASRVRHRLVRRMCHEGCCSLPQRLHGECRHQTCRKVSDVYLKSCSAVNTLYVWSSCEQHGWASGGLMQAMDAA
jgi:hypothetical protein